LSFFSQILALSGKRFRCLDKAPQSASAKIIFSILKARFARNSDGYLPVNFLKARLNRDNDLEPDSQGDFVVNDKRARVRLNNPGKAKANEWKAPLAAVANLKAKKEFMKRNVVLVLDADADTARAVASAAAIRSCDLRFVQTSKEFFHFCREDFENVNAIILDVDPGMYGMAMLEASDVCENTPPIIVVSALEEQRLSPVVQRHGAMACLGKPLSVTRLGRALDQAVERAAAPRCDLWGHVTNCTCSCCRTSVLQQFAAAN